MLAPGGSPLRDPAPETPDGGNVSGLLTAVAAAGALLLLVLVWAAASALFGATGRRIQRLALANPVPIGEASEGQRVKLQGRVSERTPSPAASRVTGEPLVCSRLALTYHDRGGRYFELDRNVAFLVADESGEAEISVERATVQFGANKRECRLEGAALEGWAREAIENDGVTFAGAPGGRLDVEEQLLAPGDEVAVLGIARWRDGAGPGGARRLSIEPDPVLGVFISGHRSAFD
jgi:hypothetical protein